MEQFRKNIPLLYSNGLIELTEVVGFEEELENGDSVARLTLSIPDCTLNESSERGFFDALRRIRLILEKRNILVCCFGGSENVYPSPMQESMGLALLAYRNQHGRQALSADIVNIFDTDDSIKPTTVKDQEDFHRRWLSSL